MRKESRQDVADEVDQEMADHVCHEVASPKIGGGQDRSEGKGDSDVGPATGPVGDGEDDEGYRGRQVTIQPKGLQAFDRVAAIEQFFDDAGSSRQRAWPARAAVSPGMIRQARH